MNEATHGERAAGYWKAQLRLIAMLLATWFVASLVAPVFLVERLNQFRFLGMPLGFWFAHQGSIVIFVLLILVYVLGMERLDRRYGVG